MCAWPLEDDQRIFYSRNDSPISEHKIMASVILKYRLNLYSPKFQGEVVWGKDSEHPASLRDLNVFSNTGSPGVSWHIIFLEKPADFFSPG